MNIYNELEKRFNENKQIILDGFPNNIIAKFRNDINPDKLTDFLTYYKDYNTFEDLYNFLLSTIERKTWLEGVKTLYRAGLTDTLADAKNLYEKWFLIKTSIEPVKTYLYNDVLDFIHSGSHLSKEDVKTHLDRILYILDTKNNITKIEVSNIDKIKDNFLNIQTLEVFKKFKLFVKQYSNVDFFIIRF